MPDFADFDPSKRVWKPRPLRRTERPEPYPVYTLPPIIRDAVEEVADFVQAPDALIAASALSAVSTAVQTCFSVQRDARLSGPASLYLLTVAESGERKSTVDKMFTAAVRDWEAKQARVFRKARLQYDAAMAEWRKEGKALDDRLKVEGVGDATGGDFDPRVIHAMNMPVEPKLRSILYGDDTPEALAIALADYPVASIISAEAGIIFGSHGMNADSVTRNLAQANAMWDGDAIRQGRVGRERLSVEGMRVTMGLQVQPAVLDAFVQRTGGLARGIGYFARFLFCHPETTQGRRYYKPEATDRGALHAFNERVTTLLDKPAEFDEHDRLMPHFVGLDAEAFEAWQRFHDEVEEQVGDGQEFAGIRDVASKAADNAARLACCLHVFTASPSMHIGRATMHSACVLMRWYLAEALRFARARDCTEEVQNAEKLEEWLVSERRKRGEQAISVNDARQKGPGVTRLKSKLEDALDILESHGRIAVLRVAGTKTRVVEIAPQVLAEWG